MTDHDGVLDRLETLFTRHGAEAYAGEPVTVAGHMLQCAALAQAEDAPEALVAAALLHDVGHLTGALGEYTPKDTDDRRHEQAGADALAGFPEVVIESVRLHVAAKRYLCAYDPRYVDSLSTASKHTLSLQGGPMTAAEMAAFTALPYHREAVRVRTWDDMGKTPDQPTPDFSAFRPLLRRLLVEASSESR